jgi:Zn-dependent protease
MESTIKLGRIWGIPIGLHFSWFFIFGLLTWSLATGYFPRAYPQLSGPAYWAIGAVTSLLFAGSVLAHELGHALIALRNRIPVRAITLFIFGGVAVVEREPDTPGVEFRIAIAGPIVSLFLGLLFAGIWLLDRTVPMLSAPSEYLMRINLILAVFNMLPGFPLDGGRVLRAVVWRMTGSFQRATRFATGSGQVVAFAFIGLGVLIITSGRFFDGLWLAFIGWFLQNAAASAQAHSSMHDALRDVKVAQVMSSDCVEIPSLTPISRVVEEQVLTGGSRCFIVYDDGQVDGILTLQDISRVPKEKWPFTTTRQAMMPVERMIHVHPDSDLLAALQQLDSANVAQLPVMRGDQLVGLLTRERILHYLRTRAELGV